MFRSFSFKTLVLLVALTGLLVLMALAVRGSFLASPTEAGRTPTFLEQFVVAGGPIVWFVLLPMSLLMVYLAADYSFCIRRKRLLPGDIRKRIVEAVRRTGPEALDTSIGDSDDFVSTAVVRAVTQGRGDWFRMRSLLFESLEEQALRLLRKIEWVNLIGNVSPMVGLFGTVFGMIKLFNAIVTAGGQPQPAQLAAGISVALVTTFWGLLIAIPALAIHGFFRNRIDTLVSAATTEAESILPEIVSSLNRAKEARPSGEKSSVVKSEIREIASTPAGRLTNRPAGLDKAKG
ncbi:MAG TPA: MotA/TolQ/ExbB proton channel family protein [Sedimentisphaerales bacterium]|nr:MotA/TolQ/ExbB proton channel family protein [Sedimentisphaerales bacterium]